MTDAGPEPTEAVGSVVTELVGSVVAVVTEAVVTEAVVAEAVVTEAVVTEAVVTELVGSVVAVGKLVALAPGSAGPEPSDNQKWWWETAPWWEDAPSQRPDATAVTIPVPTVVVVTSPVAQTASTPFLKGL
jgi:hypothetical protein